ncbi:23163_t:CDS:2, partial [Racocetra persica]
LGPGMGYTPRPGDKNFDGLILIKNIQDAERAINLIINQGEGSRDKCMVDELKDVTINVKISGEIKAGNQVKIYGTIEAIVSKKNGTTSEKPKVGTIKGTMEGRSYNDNKINWEIYGKIKSASESEYQLWPVVDDPNFVNYTDPSTHEDRSYADQNIVTTLIAFNAAYSYLLLLLQVVWRTDGQE